MVKLDGLIKKKIIIISVGFTVAMVGFYLWVKDIGRSLVNDELWTVYFSSPRHLKTYGQMFSFIRWMPAVNPPLHPFLLRIWISFFGDGEISIRLPSIIFGLISLFVFYRLVNRMFSGQIALVSTVFLFFSYPHTYFVSVSRNYSLFFMLSLLSMYYFWDLLKVWERKSALFYILWTSLMLYTHYFSLFFLLAQVVYLAYKRLISRRWLFVFTGLTISYLPWIRGLYYHSLRLKFGSWVTRVNIAKGIYQQLTFFGITGWGWLSILPLLVAGGGIFVLLRYHRSRAFFLLAWLVIPIAVPLVISQFTMPFFVTRFMFVSLAPVIILFALGLCNFLKRNIVLAGAVLLFAAFVSFPPPHAPYPLEHEDWRTAFQLISREKRPAVVLYPVSTATKMAVEYYGKPTIRLITKEVFENSCPRSVYVFSRYEDFRLPSSCNYAIKKHMNIAPYVFEYRLKEK